MAASDSDTKGSDDRGALRRYPRSLLLFLRKKWRQGTVDYRPLQDTSPDLVSDLQETEICGFRTTDEGGPLTTSLREVIAELRREGETPDSDGMAASDQELVDLETAASSLPDASSRYVVERRLAAGGTSAIFLARDQDLSRRVAIKVLVAREGTIRGNGGKERLERVARFLEEAEVTAQLDHPSIVSVHDVGFDSMGHPYFTMGHVKGRNLSEVFRLARKEKDGWNLLRAVGVLVKACQGMAYAHAKGVIHRDLKPDNIMVGRFGEVYLMDWGLAKVMGREDSRSAPSGRQDESDIHSSRSEAADLAHSPIDTTVDGTVFGTPVYMPPEQAQGRIHEITERSDIYSLGAILYTLLAGRHPYFPDDVDREENYPVSILGQVLSGPPKPVSAINPKASPELVAICEKAMARNPEARYGSSLELAEDLQAFLDNRVVKAYQSGTIAELNKLIQRNKRTAIVVVVSVLALTACLAFMLVAHRRLNELIEEAREGVRAPAPPAATESRTGSSAPDGLETERR